MSQRPAVLHELYKGTTTRAVKGRYVLMIFDVLVIAYFVVTTFLPQYRWITYVDFAIGSVLAVEFLAHLWAERDRLKFLLQPLTVLDMIVILSLFAPALAGGYAFLRVMRALRLLRSYIVLRRLRSESRFFARNEEIIASGLNLAVFIFVITALVFVLQAETNPSITNYVDALYFTITTLTTTGFGDIVLVGSAGRLLAVVIMIVGVTLFIHLVRAIFRPRRVRHDCPDCGLARHDPDAVHCKHCGRLLHIESEGI